MLREKNGDQLDETNSKNQKLLKKKNKTDVETWLN